MIQRTLKELREELTDLLGMSALQATAGSALHTLNGIIRRAQQQIYWEYDWDDLEEYFSFATVASTQDYAHPANGAGLSYEPRKIKSVHVVDTAGVWRPLHEGISPDHYTDSTENIPCRFARLNVQLRLWPTPDAVYTIQILAPVALSPLTADSDTTTLDSELVFLLAAAKAKRRYRQPDAQEYQNEFGLLLSRMRAANHGTRRYIPGDDRPPVPPLPKMVP